MHTAWSLTRLLHALIPLWGDATSYAVYGAMHLHIELKLHLHLRRDIVAKTAFGGALKLRRWTCLRKQQVWFFCLRHLSQCGSENAKNRMSATRSIPAVVSRSFIQFNRFS